MWAGRHVIGQFNRADVADPSQDHLAFAVLGRLLSPGVLQLPGGPRDRAKILLEPAQRFGFVELSCHNQHDIVGLVKLLVKRAQVFHRHTLDVAPVANGWLAVVVPVVGGGGEPLAEHAGRRVFAAFEFVAHHGHLGVKVLLFDGAVDHPVRFKLQSELEVFVCRSQRLKIVHPVAGGAAVELRAVFLQFFRHVRMLGRAFEHHVLQQVGHACLAVAFLAGTDQHRHVDRDLRLRAVREEQHPQAIVELVLSDALNGGDFSRPSRREGNLRDYE